MNKSNSINTTIFTDGSSRGNPGRGGWGAIVIETGDQRSEIGERRTEIRDQRTEIREERTEKRSQSLSQVIELGGYEKITTNNRMELTACFQGLSHAPKDVPVTIFTDSSYVINGITKWIKGWRRNGWKRLDPKTRAVVGEVLNRDLWEKLDEVATGRKVKWKYVGGHIGIIGNERCDHIATDFADGNEVKLFKGSFSDYDLPNILDISPDVEKVTNKKSNSSRSNTRAYSYVSRVDGVIETHRTWSECEQRVKGVKGVRYKKSLDVADEAKIIAEFGAL